MEGFSFDEPNNCYRPNRAGFVSDIRIGKSYLMRNGMTAHIESWEFTDGSNYYGFIVSNTHETEKLMWNGKGRSAFGAMFDLMCEIK